MPPKACAPCSGTGIISMSGYYRCEDCDGQGEIGLGMEGRGLTYFTCRRCAGKGRVWQTVRDFCPDCLATGVSTIHKMSPREYRDYFHSSLFENPPDPLNPKRTIIRSSRPNSNGKLRKNVSRSDQVGAVLEWFKFILFIAALAWLTYCAAHYQ